MVVNADASVQDHVGVGIGWHIQTWSDTQGRLLKTITKGYDYLSDNYTSEEAEMLALTRAVKEALEEGERDYLRIKSDCKPLVEKIKDGRTIKGSGAYMDSFFHLLDFVDEWEIQWVKRNKNSCADRQASTALEPYL